MSFGNLTVRGSVASLAPLRHSAWILARRGSRRWWGIPRVVMRIRVGDYRVVYQIEDGRVLVTVVRVARRREVYRKL
ncbi:type II toxin-antitoxin system RelE family toxin [Actinophytocola sp.]|uniref:type II toxin-antitoxin system RelE family toxin n=1 Tax=Actinophytocola sp. TaxID=1872138 RepID=UPI003D6C5D67